MAKGRAVAIVLDDAERGELTAVTRKHGAPQALAERARIVLAAASGLNNREIAAKVGVCAETVRIPMIPITRSGGSRSVIPIDPDQCGVA
jgi:DNA-binding NarL/FixJ family response regulator